MLGRFCSVNPAASREYLKLETTTLSKLCRSYPARETNAMFAETFEPPDTKKMPIPSVVRQSCYERELSWLILSSCKPLHSNFITNDILPVGSVYPSSMPQPATSSSTLLLPA